MHHLLTIFIFIAHITATSLLHSDIQPIILYTAALIENQYETRKQEYLKSLNILNLYGYTPFIVESVNQEEKSFFDNTRSHVLYTKSNNSLIRNKGVNEFVSLKKALEHYQFDPDTMIVKLTGRYFFTSNNLLKNIEQHPEIDGWVKYDAHGQIFTGCFALRTRYLMDLINKINFNLLEQRMINIESVVANYIQLIRNKGASIRNCDILHVTANIFGDGKGDLHHL